MNTVICDQCHEAEASELWDDTVALCGSCYEGREPKPRPVTTGDLDALRAEFWDVISVLVKRIEKNETHIRCVDQALSTDIFLGGLDE